MSSRREPNAARSGCSYSALKKQIYIIEKENHQWRASRETQESSEYTGLITRTENAGEAAFEHLLDRELKKITLFYQTQEKELLDQLAELEVLVALKEEEGPQAGYGHVDDEDDDDDDEDDLEDSRLLESPTSPRPPLQRKRSLPRGHGYAIFRQANVLRLTRLS